MNAKQDNSNSPVLAKHVNSNKPMLATQSNNNHVLAEKGISHKSKIPAPTFQDLLDDDMMGILLSGLDIPGLSSSLDPPGVVPLPPLDR